MTKNSFCDIITDVPQESGTKEKVKKDISNRIEKDDKNQQTINWCKYQLCNWVKSVSYTHLEQKQAYAMTCTLLTNSEGKKMGKTAKGASIVVADNYLGDDKRVFKRCV